jgi:hypothetical protein
MKTIDVELETLKVLSSMDKTLKSIKFEMNYTNQLLDEILKHVDKVLKQVELIP